jgi:glucose-6-phosphate isomerase
MKQITLNINKVLGFITKEQIFAQETKAKECIATLHHGTGKGNDFLGWLHLPTSISEADINDIQATANKLRTQCEVVVVVGIGGSYLGAKAVIDAISGTFDSLEKNRKNPDLTAE